LFGGGGVKVATVGLGYWGPKLLRNLVGLVGPERVVAVEQRPHRRALLDEFPGVRYESSLRKALNDDDIEAVVLATPLATHARLARQALRAGRHVLVEKPLADSVQDAVGLCRLADDLRLRLMVGHTFLFSPRVQTVASRIAEGATGPIHYVTSERLNLGIHQSDANVLWDLAPHDFSIVFHLLDEHPVRVHAMAHGVVRPDVPDVAFVNMAFPSGAVASVSVSWLAPRKVRSTVIVGERGMIIFDDTRGDEPVKIYDKGVVVPESADFGQHQLTYRYGDTVSPYVAADEPLRLELAHFLECVSDPRTPCLTDGWSGVEVVKALAAADRSWRTGGVPVAVEERRSVA
jgi:predicted dehydrogenase